MTIVQVLGLLLALSVAGNAWLFHERTGLLVRDGAVTQLATDTKAAAKACSDGVSDLERSSNARAADIKRMLAGESGRILTLQHESLEAQRARPADPADLCKSIDLWLSDQIRTRRQAEAQK